MLCLILFCSDLRKWVRIFHDVWVTGWLSSHCSGVFAGIVKTVWRWRRLGRCSHVKLKLSCGWLLWRWRDRCRRLAMNPIISAYGDNSIWWHSTSHIPMAVATRVTPVDRTRLLPRSVVAEQLRFAGCRICGVVCVVIFQYRSWQMVVLESFIASYHMVDFVGVRIESVTR